MTSKVGTFNKATTTGNQVVTHNLGETPKFLILWAANEFVGGAYNFLFGIYDGASNYCIAATELNAAATSDSDKRIAAKMISMINSSGTVIWEATITAWSSTTFTLNFTTNDLNTIPIHYMIVGGAELSAKLIQWNYPTSTGNLGITGVGFKPDSYITFHAGLAAAVPDTATDANFGIGFASVGSTEKAIGYFSDTAEATATDTSRAQQSRVLTNPATDQSQSINASHVSFDADGATVNILAGTGAARKIVSLFLKGAAVRCGVFNKSTSTSTPVSQAVTGLGIKPELLMLMSAMATASASVQTEARIAIGASDGTNEGCDTYKSEDNQADSDVDAFNSETKIIQISDNDSTTIQAEADLSSFDDDGFTLSWTTNNAVATEIIYFAMGELDFTLNETFALDETLTTEDVPIILLETFALDEELTEAVSFTLEEEFDFLDSLLHNVHFILEDELDGIDSVSEHIYLDSEDLELEETLSTSTTSILNEIFALAELLLVSYHDFVLENFALDEFLIVKERMYEDFALSETVAFTIRQPLSEDFSLSESLFVSTSGTEGDVSPDILFEAEDYDVFFEATNPERLA